MDTTERFYENCVLCGLLILFSYLFYIARTSPSYTFEGIASMEFPSWIFIIVLLLCAIKLIGNIMFQIKRGDKQAASKEKVSPKINLSIFLIVLYAVMWNIVGFSISSFSFVSVEAKILRPQISWKIVLLIGFLVTVAVDIVFGLFFNIDFPEPIFEIIQSS